MTVFVGAISVATCLLIGWQVGWKPAAATLLGGAVFIAVAAAVRGGFPDSDGEGSGVTVFLFWIGPIVIAALLILLGAAGRRVRHARTAKPSNSSRSQPL